MNRQKYSYIILSVLLLLTAAVYFLHARPAVGGLFRILDQSHYVRFPFEIQGGKVFNLLPEAASAGMHEGDWLIGIGGNRLMSDTSMAIEINKYRPGENVTYNMERADENGGAERVDIVTEGVPLSLTFAQAAREFSITFLFLLCLPALSFLLGFYVAFMRPRDPLAWILCFMLIGIGSIALESSTQGTLVKAYQETALSSIGIWMLLFGIYFPERLPLDRKYPWIKWILLGPISAAVILNVGEQTGRFLEMEWLWRPINNLTEPFDGTIAVMEMLAMSAFFACLATKSAMIENRDSRRRLRILYYGTSAAMLPALVIIIYRLASGRHGSFFELAPAWLAILALLSILLFPITVAYVIVVQRAMDVSVVIRQGLQYALAKNGVRLLQFVLLVVVVLITVSIVRNYGENIPAQIGFVASGLAVIPLIEYGAKRLGVWLDKRFFREAYNAEQILVDLSEDVRSIIETQPLLETVSTKISEALHVPQVALLLRNGGAFHPAYALGYADAPRVELGEETHTVGKLRSNEPLVIYQDDSDSWLNQENLEAERAGLRELGSQLLLPVGVKDELSGVISLGPKRSEEPYSPNDIRLLKSVAAQTGLALENSRLTEAIAAEAAQKERLNREVEIAREVQERLFPQDLPCVEGLDLFGACRPALGVGGDYYDFFDLADGKVGIAIGDISGKGIGASLMMASLQASLRGQTIHFGDDLSALMSRINDLVYQASTTNRYATFFYAQYDPATRNLAYVNAGHNPPFLLRRDGSVVRLEDGGPVVGMLPPMLVSYTRGAVRIDSGDLLVGFTDGISEAMNPNEEEWGEDALLECLREISDKKASEILAIAVERADEFAAGAKQHDDMTMVVVKAV